MDGPLAVGSRKAQLVLAALLVDVGKVVPRDVLIDRVWGDAPPREARSTLYAHLTRLRGVIRAADPSGDPWGEASQVASRVASQGLDGSDPIAQESGGYRLTYPPYAVDLHRFRDLLIAARGHENAERRFAGIGAALSLWQDDALLGLTGEWADTLRRELDDERHTARLDWFDAAIACGRDEEVLPQIQKECLARPYDDRLVGNLLVCLCRAGRQGEALRCYGEFQERLARDYQASPGPRLRELHERIVRADPELLRRDEPAWMGPDQAAATVEPAGERPSAAELPAQVRHFTGREREIELLDGALSEVDSGEGASNLVTITGAAGVGKTALATQWAHRARDRFPDGQLYVNLRGFDHDREPRRPAEVLGQLLRALGLAPAQIPLDEDDQARLYRSMLADRRVLVVLDNAVAPDQVRPLLPGSRGCRVVVTSRNRLSGLVALEGAQPLPLSQLTEEEALDLLAAAAGDARVAAEPDAAGELVRLCAGLPLALRITAARITCGMTVSLSEAAAELAEGDVLSALDPDGDTSSGVRSAFALSYRGLGPDARRAFRLLGMVPGSDVTVPATAELLNVSARQATELVRELVRAHMAEPSTPGRFHMHDLLRGYAREACAAEDSAAERDAALDRLFQWYAGVVAGASVALPWHFPYLPDTPPPTSGPSGAAPAGGDPRQALLDLEAEQANLTAAVEYAAAHGPREFAWRLTAELARFFWACVPPSRRVSTVKAALDGARADGSLRGQAAMHDSMGHAYRDLGRLDEAREHHEQALELYRAAGPVLREGISLGSLALVDLAQGRLGSSLSRFAECLRLSREIERPDLEMWPWVGLGAVLRDQGRLREAVSTLERGIALQRRAGSPFEIVPSYYLAMAYTDVGRLDDAGTLLTDLLAANGAFGLKAPHVPLMEVLARVDILHGKHEEALQKATTVLRLAELSSGTALVAALENTVGAALRNLGRLDEALAAQDRALACARGMRAPLLVAETLRGRSAVLRRLGRHQESEADAAAALVVSERHGYRRVVGEARTELAASRLSLGRRASALGLLRTAVLEQRQIGHVLGEARAQAWLAQTWGSLGHAEAGTRAARRSEQLFAAARAHTQVWD